MDVVEQCVGVEDSVTEELVILSEEFLQTSEECQRIRSEISLMLTEHTYRPKLTNIKDPQNSDDWRADWLATSAVPAFKQWRREHPYKQVKAFASIGTGAGLDALAAIEIFNPQVVVVTDIHEDVVEQALDNIRSNLLNPENVTLIGVVGNLAEPLKGLGISFDLIYENLPNIPLPETTELRRGINSASYFEQEAGFSSSLIQKQLLELHAKACLQVKPLLSTSGEILCSIGARIPLANMIIMAEQLGYQARIINYHWKVQSEAFDVVSGYAEEEKKGNGPFNFYPLEVAEKAFAKLTTAQAIEQAAMIENNLHPYAMNAQTSLGFVQDGCALAHTVAVVACKLA